MYRHKARLEAKARGAIVSRYTTVETRKYSPSLGFYSERLPFDLLEHFFDINNQEIGYFDAVSNIMCWIPRQWDKSFLDNSVIACDLLLY